VPPRIIKVLPPSTEEEMALLRGYEIDGDRKEKAGGVAKSVKEE